MGWSVVIALIACGGGFLALLTYLVLTASEYSEDERLSNRALLFLGVLMVLLGFTAIYFLVEYALEDLSAYAG